MPRKVSLVVGLLGLASALFLSATHHMDEMGALFPIFTVGLSFSLFRGLKIRP